MTRTVQAKITVETPEMATEEPQGERRPSPPGLGEPYSFLKYAASLNLDGPEDWSENLDDYLYRGKKLPDA